MIVFVLTALAAAAAQTSLAPPASPSADCAKPVSEACIAGAWTGSFASSEWTFELTREGAGWSGRYMNSRVGLWKPLQSLAVAGTSVAFALDTQPRITFALTLDPGGDALTGNLRFADRPTVPFAAKRSR